MKENPVPARETLITMLAAIRHRGPDGFGIYRDPQVGLGSARLSIIDLSGGDQPIGNEDGTSWIVFNGEIFNYVELRPELEKRGHRFSTQTDTEVILHLFEDYGPGCLNFLNGQFVLAIWDTVRRRLFLARDRVGVRPLYYTLDGNHLVFGSEIKSIFACPGITPEIDPRALRETFIYWSPQSPRSIFKGIFELPPGHFMQVEDGAISIQPYWALDLAPTEARRSEEDYLEEFDDLLNDAARIRLRADVPVGAYLSGGLDSSVTTALARKHHTNRLDTFSISFTDPQFDESSYQGLVSRALGTDHHEVYCSYADIGRSFPDVVWHTEAPILRTSPAPMFLLSRLVHQNHFKVVLTGEGADEFLAGYDIFKEMKVRRFWARDPSSKLRPKLLARLYPDITRLRSTGAFLQEFFKKDLLDTSSPFYSHRIRWTNTARTLRLFSAPADTQAIDPAWLALPAGFSSWPGLSQAQYLEIVTFLSPYLLSSQGDRMAMAHSVEGRYPFLDFRVMEFCNRLPPELKMPVLTEKWLLKMLARKYVPDVIWQRVKRPYRAPIQRSFFDKEPLPYVGELLSETALVRTGFFDPAAVERLRNKAAGGAQLSESDDMALVGILSTQLVDHLFIQKKNSGSRNGKVLPLKLVEKLAGNQTATLTSGGTYEL